MTTIIRQLILMVVSYYFVVATTATSESLLFSTKRTTTTTIITAKTSTSPSRSFLSSSLSSSESTYSSLLKWRGGDDGTAMMSINNDNVQESDEIEPTTEDPYTLLARATKWQLQQQQQQQSDGGDNNLELSKIVKALRSMSAAQKTFKGLDGAAHEAYQRTHHDDTIDMSVSGRAQRTAIRTGVTADGLFACELCEFYTLYQKQQKANENSSSWISMQQSDNGTLSNGRQVILNVTDAATLTTRDTTPSNTSSSKKKHRIINHGNVSVMVIYDPNYHGGAGIYHGGIEETTSSNKSNGRLLIIITDTVSKHLDRSILQILQQSPKHVQYGSNTKNGTSSSSSMEIVSVQPILYKTAGEIVTNILDPIIRSYDNTTAIHLVGHSLSGGIASIIGIMLHGDIPIPMINKTKKIHQQQPKGKTTRIINKSAKKKQKRQHGMDTNSTKMKKETNDDDIDNDNGNGNDTDTDKANIPLPKLCKGRVSVVALGSPPCISANVYAEYITSFMYGDDIITRTTSDSLQRFYERGQRTMKHDSIIGKRINFMTDAFTLAKSNIQSHVIGSDGEEIKLSFEIGNSYIIRPRKYSGMCSIHEIGIQQLKNIGNSREAIRAAILWQLHDILLSRSLWKHHQLYSYIYGLDRVHLRHLEED